MYRIFIALALLAIRKGMMRRPRLPECSFLLSHITGCNDDDDDVDVGYVDVDGVGDVDDGVGGDDDIG